MLLDITYGTFVNIKAKMRKEKRVKDIKAERKKNLI